MSQTAPRALLAASLALALALPTTAAQSTPIAVQTLSDGEGGATLAVTGPASARGVLVVGTAPRVRPLPLTTEGGLVLQLAVEPRAVLAIRTDARGRWTRRVEELPEGLLLQALFPGAGLAGSGLGAGSTSAGSGFSDVTPSVSCPQPVFPGDVVITEIQRDPAAVADSEGEWFELTNTSPCDIDLEGWSVLDENGQGFLISTGVGVVVPAQGKLVLGRSLDPAQNGGVPVDYEYSNFLFDELADRIVLQDPLGTEMERVEWDATWPANQAGRALALEPGTSAAGNDLPGAWCLASTPIGGPGSVDFGTPGEINPSCGCLGQEDLPDASFVDSNCDGIDGDRWRAVFVAVTGSPSGLGTINDPVDSVSLALQIAASDPARDHVYVSKGVYTESLQLRDGVSIWGGYDAAAGWTRSSTHTTRITYDVPNNPPNWPEAEVVTLSGTGLTQAIVVGDLEVRAARPASNPGPATTNIAVQVHQVDDLVLERVRLVAEAGWDARDGSDSYQYDSAILWGGDGGQGGPPSSSGDDGKPGEGSGGGAGGSGGFYGEGGVGGAATGQGADGTPGYPGSDPTPTLIGGEWEVPDGSGGLGGPGAPGSGGGGGGGGAGGFLAGPGGDGGNGGAGGYGGLGGKGAFPGGSSVALVASSSQVELVDCVLEAADGGAGGSGGQGYPGRIGFTGHSGQTSSGGYRGGDGGNGAPGGQGGQGGAGAGGSSVGVVAGSLATVTPSGSTSITHGVGGQGGSGPTAAPDGLAAAVLTVPE